MTIERVITLDTANPTARFAADSRHRYFISSTGTLDGGTFTVKSYSKELNESVTITGITPTLGSVFYSDDPYLEFDVSGAGALLDVTITAIMIITRDRGV